MCVSKLYLPQEVSKVIGVGLSRLLGWKADLRNPQLEVNLTVVFLLVFIIGYCL